MEGVTWQKGVAKLRVAKLVVAVLVESLYEQCELVVCDNQAQIKKSSFQVFRAGLTCPILIKYPKRIDQVEVSLQAELNFCPLNLSFDLKLCLKNEYCVIINLSVF